MYTDMETGSPTEYVTAIVWGEDNGGTQQVQLWVLDNFSGQVFNTIIASDAVAPDVIIGDDGSGISGNIKIAVVYRDISVGNSDIYYVEIPFTNMCNPSGGGAPTQGVMSAPVMLNTNDGFTPHIDAYPDPATGYWGIGNPYRALSKFGITWSETNGAIREVWTAPGDLAGGGVGVPVQLYDGFATDIGCAYDVTAGADLAHIVYRDDITGDLTHMTYDFTNSVLSAATTLETATTTFPCIDAMNVYVPSTGNIPWVVTAQLGLGSSATIRSYDPLYGMFDFAAFNPFVSPGAAGFKPAIATGPGPDDYNGLISEFGNNKYLEMFAMDIAELEATDYDATTALWGGYYEVNMTPLNTTSTFGIRERAGRAVSTSSNCGVGHMAAWVDYNGSNFFIGWKVNTGTTAAFRPGKPASIVTTRTDDYSVYPNPAERFVGVRGLQADVTYTAIDITGRIVQSGTVYSSDPKIDVSKLTNGMYIFKFNEKGSVHQLKFLKQ